MFSFHVITLDSLDNFYNGSGCLPVGRLFDFTISTGTTDAADGEIPLII